MENESHLLYSQHNLVKSFVMRSKFLSLSSSVAALTFFTAVGLGAAEKPYPLARHTDQTDSYHGTIVADPFRWLEDDNSAETKAWVEAENKVTFAYLDKIEERKAIR